MIRFDFTPVFLKNSKRLAGKYPSFKDDLQQLLLALSDDPNQGVALADGYRKIRMAIKSKGKGKSGGARVITLNCLVAQNEGIVTLVSIYDKSDLEISSMKEIRKAYSSLTDPRSPNASE